MFNNKHATPYGPGAPKSPVPGEGVLGKKAAMKKHLLQAMDKHVAVGPDYYVEVATALGFTRNEVDALVRANDSGLSFLEIADLIGKHPPVWSAAMTPARRKEETDFVRLVGWTRSVCR